MLRFLYTTDLHGDVAAYALLPELCRAHGVGIIVNGGDMLPKGRDMIDAQRGFIEDDLPDFLLACDRAGICFYGLFGNDDLRTHHRAWLDLAHASPRVFDLCERWHELPGGIIIRGNSFVPDYLFGLKDWCMRDHPDAPPVPTRGRSIVTDESGVRLIDDPVAFFRARPWLGEHLDSLVEPGRDLSRAILVTHAPPGPLGLGTLWDGTDAGSRAVLGWIDRHAPLLTLSGHIHESPDAHLEHHGELRHTAARGRTTCHQPGQTLPGALVYSIVETDGARARATRFTRDM